MLMDVEQPATAIASKSSGTKAAYLFNSALPRAWRSEAFGDVRWDDGPSGYKNQHFGFCPGHRFPGTS